MKNNKFAKELAEDKYHQRKTPGSADYKRKKQKLREKDFDEELKDL